MFIKKWINYFIMFGVFFADGGEGGGAAEGGEPSGGEPSGGGEPQKGSVLGGEPSPGDPQKGQESGGEPAGEDPNGGKPQSIHGDLADKIQWPEGFDDQLKEDPTIKKFVREDGSIDYANALKSYHHAQKQIGKDKVTIPDPEIATQEEIDSFWEKVGFKKNPEEYNLQKPENTQLDDDFIKDFKEAAHKNRIPQKQANEMLNFFNEKSSKSLEQMQQEQQQQIEENVNTLKKEFGNSFEQKVNAARKVVRDFGGDEIVEAMKDPAIGSNAKVVKLLTNIADKFYGEDKHIGDTAYSGAISPTEAQEKLDSIYGDPKHPYHNPNHPNFKKAQDEVHKLFQYKNNER